MSLSNLDKNTLSNLFNMLNLEEKLKIIILKYLNKILIYIVN